VARNAGVNSVPSLPPGWCTWYHYFQEVREEDVLENLAAVARLGLEVGIVQIDDGYQAEIGDWLDRSPRFAHPLAELAGRIQAEGRRAGIWTAPLLVGAHSKLAAEHRDWLVGGADAGHNWGQPLGALDVTNPDAAAHLQHVFRSLADWGFDFFKIDFMYAGALSGRRHSDSSGVAAYREAVRLIREAIGPKATLLGCGAPILPSVGLFDAMRISPDVGPLYEPGDGDLGAPSQRSAVLTGRARAFQHARFWVNDPDCLIVRPEVERREDWAEHVERFGGLRISSDRLEDLDAWGLEVTRRLLRPSPTEPFDLSSPPRA
jgi:alpha-galactosidase